MTSSIVGISFKIVGTCLRVLIDLLLLTIGLKLQFLPSSIERIMNTSEYFWSYNFLPWRANILFPSSSLKYDDKLKQESILRLEKEKATKELEASRERTAKWAFFIGVLGLLILLVLGYYLYKQRVRRLKTQNRADRVEASYKTEAVLSQRLHDDFGAGLHHVMLLVQSKSEPEKILNELDKLYQQSRDFSREINAVDTGVNYKEALYTMLDQIKPENTRLLISGSKEIAWQVLSNVTKITLYKVLRELFINMAKHSQATIVTLNFKTNSDDIEIRYSDNGVGVSQNEKIIKNGLLNTEKRIEAIGGTITFDKNLLSRCGSPLSFSIDSFV